MSRIWTLALKEWKGFFFTPFALVILPLYLVLCGTYFYGSLDTYLQLSTPTETLKSVHGLNVMSHLLIPFSRDLANVLIFIIPLMTMRTFAEERKTGTYDLLVSYPLRPFELFMGKYAGVLALTLFLLLMSSLFPLVVIWRGEPYVPQIVSAYLGLALFLIFYTAVGVVGSLLTENQFIAAIIAYGAVLASVVLQWLAYITPAPWDRVFANFLFVAHLDSFRNGLIFVGDVVAYLTATAALLLFGYLRLRRHYR